MVVLSVILVLLPETTASKVVPSLNPAPKAGSFVSKMGTASIPFTIPITFVPTPTAPDEVAVAVPIETTVLAVAPSLNASPILSPVSVLPACPSRLKLIMLEPAATFCPALAKT